MRKEVRQMVGNTAFTMMSRASFAMRSASSRRIIIPSSLAD